MDEQQIRKIIREEIASAAQQAQYSVTRVPVHTHNNIDAPNIAPHNIIGFQSLPGCSEGDGIMCLSTGQSISGPPTDGSILNPPQIVVFPIPVMYSGSGGAASFNGGDAPYGTVVLFDTGGAATTGLYVKTLNGWYFFSRTSGPT